MIYVIGSGPAGVSATLALLNNNYKVTMLDAGFELEPDKAQLVNQLRQQDKKNWSRRSINAIKEKMAASIDGVNLKYIYGSDYPYRGMDQYTQVNGAKVSHSLAKGGLSTVWGASILPYRESDIKEWPISIRDLTPHYRAALSLLPLSGRRDGLRDALSTHAEFQQHLTQCHQISEFMADLDNNRNSLRAKDIYFGYSRLAVRVSQNGEGPGCSYCGMCLYGCPYGNIYSAASTVNEFMKHKNFNYRKDVLVERIIEGGSQVTIHARSVENSEKLNFHGSLVFLAAGVFSSTRILLRSLEAFGCPVKIQHSEHFQIPLIRYQRTPNVRTEDLYTLAQLSLLLLQH